MAGEVFISYRRSDEPRARLLHALLKERGIEAWYDAHVGAGEDWRNATAKALIKAPIFVLLFSRNAADSDDIAKELAAATFQKKLVIPVRIENIQPDGAFLYELAARNWFDAYEDTEARLALLADRIAALVKAGPDAPAALPDSAIARPATTAPARRVGPIAIGGVLLAGLAVVAAALIALNPPGKSPNIRTQSPRVAFFGLTATGPDPAPAIAAATTTELSQSLTNLQMDLASLAETQGAGRASLERARELGATYALSGEALSDGGDLRISMRLEDVPSRTTLWEENFSGEPTPVALRVRTVSRTSNTLQCIMRMRSDLPDGGNGLLQLIANSCKSGTFASLEQAGPVRDLASRAPDSPYTQARLAGTIALRILDQPKAQRAALAEEAERAMQRAEKLAPNERFVRTMRALLMMQQNEPLAEVEQFLLQSFELPYPNESSIGASGLNFRYALLLADVGRTEEALSHMTQAAGYEAYNPGANYGMGRLQADMGQPLTAARTLEATFARIPLAFGWEDRMRLAALRGVGDAEAILDAPSRDVKDETIGCWRDILGALSSKGRSDARSIRAFHECGDRRTISEVSTLAAAGALGDIGYAYEFASRPDTTLASLGQSGILFSAETQPMRREQRFIKLAEDLGLWDYWMTASKTPDACTSDESNYPYCAKLKAELPTR